MDNNRSAFSLLPDLRVASLRARAEGFFGSLNVSPVASRLIHGTLWSLLGALASRGFNVLVNICIARILGRENLGELAMIESTLGLFGMLTGFGLGFTATKYVAEFKLSDPLRAGRILSLAKTITFIMGMLMVVAVVVLAPWLAQSTLRRPELTPILRIGAILLLVNSLNMAQSGSLAGFEAFRQIARINLIQGVVGPFVSLPLVYLYGVKGAVVASIIGSVIGFWLCTRVVRNLCERYNIVSRRFDVSSFQELPLMWKFSLPALLSQALVGPVAWFCNSMLIRAPEGYSQLGLFNVANAWRNQLVFLVGIIPSVLLPILSSEMGDRAAFRRLSYKNLCLMWMLSLPLSVLSGLAAFLVTTLLYGHQYRDARYGALSLTALVFFVAVGGTAGTSVVSEGKMWLGAIFNFFWAALLIAFCYLFINRLGFMGMALSYWLAYFFQTILQVGYVLAKTERSVRSIARLSVLSLMCLLPIPLMSIRVVGDNIIVTALIVMMLLSVFTVREARALMKAA